MINGQDPLEKPEDAMETNRLQGKDHYLNLAGVFSNLSISQQSDDMQYDYLHDVDEQSGLQDEDIVESNLSFNFKIGLKRGFVPKDKDGKFNFLQSLVFKSKFSANTISEVSYRVIVNLPFYTGNPRSIKEVINVFENTGFKSNREESVIKAANSLIFIVGVNAMESLDPELNTKVEQKLAEPVNTQCEVHRFGFYWRPKWVDENNKEVPFEVVRERYLAIKQNSPQRAKNILDSIERPTNKIVPYRELREILKQHNYTAKMAQLLRQKYPKTPLFLGLFDPDMVSASEVFDTYSELIEDYKKINNGQIPTVLTTGYRVPNLDVKRHDSPLYAFAVDLDMAVRNATAAQVKSGVYYPEPNILVSFNSDEMVESFMEGASLEVPKTYTDPYEWPVFMEDLIQKRGIDPNKHFIFDTSNPIITLMPDRMSYVLGSDNLKIFHGQFNTDQKIVKWRISDLQYLVGTAQSHALPEAWASRLTRSLRSEEWDNKEISIPGKNGKKPKKSFKDLRFSLEKALQIFFEQLDPLSMLNKPEINNVKPDMRQFSEILENYFEKKPLFLPDQAERSFIQQNGIKKVEIIFRTRHQDIKTTLAGWSNEELQAFILYIVGEDFGKRFIRAGFNATEALVHLYRNRLNTQFSELTQVSLVAFYEECAQKTPNSSYRTNIPFTKAQEAILAGNYDPNDLQFTAAELLETGKYNLNGLHIAALVGDSRLVTYALQYVSSSLEADGHILPLHCAILYLINNGVSETNGNDLPLISQLVSEETRFTKTDIGLTALGLALTRLENAGSVVKQCMLGWNVPDFVFENIEDMARIASLRERQTPLLAIMNKLSKNNEDKKRIYTPRSIAECAKHGFSYLDAGIIENKILVGYEDGRKEITRLEEILTTTFAEAVRQDDLGTFCKIVECYEEYKLTIPSDLADRDDRPLAISAVINTKYASFWLKRLEELNVRINVEDPHEGSPILHEAISPAADRYLGGTARDKRRYYEGFRKTVEQLTSPKSISYKKLMAIEFLLNKSDIDINQQDRVGDRPLDISLDVDYPLVSWILFKRKAKIDHLTEKALDRLLQYLGLLCFWGEIKKEEVLQAINTHPDNTPLLLHKWENIINDVERLQQDSLATFKFFDKQIENLKSFFSWYKESISQQYLSYSDFIEESIERLFSFHLMTYRNVKSFFSIPRQERFQELEKIYQEMQEIFKQLSDFNDDHVKRVHKAVITGYPQYLKAQKKEKQKQINKARRNRSNILKEKKSIKQLASEQKKIKENRDQQNPSTSTGQNLSTIFYNPTDLQSILALDGSSALKSMDK